MAVKSNALRADEAAARGAAPDYSIRSVPFDAPYNWLAAGWRDLWRTPGISLAYGAIFAIAGLILTVGLAQVGAEAVIPMLAGGFVLIGPMLAAGLYETSRRLETGEPVSFEGALRFGFLRNPQLAHLGLLLLLIFLAWVEIALLLFMLFFGPEPMPPLENFLPSLLLTPRGLGLLVIGTGVGMVMAATTFAISVISAPLLMVERVDVVTAAMTSIDACRKNPLAMGLWAALVAGAMVLGFVTLFFGLVIVFPLIGHATWHAFRDVIERRS
jgi:uncharacterized membrane protein